MNRIKPGYAIATLALAAVLASCGDATGPDTRPPSDLTILRVAASAPPLEEDEISFYDVRGQSRDGRIYFLDSQGARGEEYLRLTFDGESILNGADGLPIAVGDSVLITVRVVDPARVQFEFEPAGIVFNPLHMPELRIRYDEADHDFNNDGQQNATDAQIETELALWRQEVVGTPYLKLPTTLMIALDEVEGLLPGFSRYAIAY